MPERDGPEENPCFETFVFEAAGQVGNAGSELLSVVRYHQVVSRKADGQVFRDQIGYWTWDPRTGVIGQSLTIPRAVCVLAGGKAPSRPAVDRPMKLEVSARLVGSGWGIVQSPFMRDNAKTTAYEHSLAVDGDRLSCSQTTIVEVYGRTFEHTDRNELVRQHV